MALVKVKGTGENRVVRIKGAKKPCLIICSGDSTTDAGPDGYWSKVKYYAQAAAPVIATVLNKAHAGQDVIYLQGKLQDEILQFNPDIVTVSLLLNELYNGDIQAQMTTYINTIRAHINPNGRRPIVVGMTDNPTGSDQDASRPVANQNIVHTALINAYQSFASTGEVFYADTYAAFLAFVRDSPAFFNLLDPDHIHPAKPYGHDLYMKTLNLPLVAAVTKFYNG